jgi:hypothetical protein
MYGGSLRIPRKVGLSLSSWMANLVAMVTSSRWARKNGERNVSFSP